MSVKNYDVSSGHIYTYADKINTNARVIFDYDGGWMYCGSDGWTKAEKGYHSDKNVWSIKGQESAYTQKDSNSQHLYHGDTFELDNLDYPGQSLYVYHDQGFGCSTYGIGDRFKICKVDLLKNGDC